MDIICKYDNEVLINDECCGHCLSCKFVLIWMSLQVLPEDMIREISRAYIVASGETIFIKMVAICMDYYKYCKYCAESKYKTSSQHPVFWLESKLLRRCELGFSTCWRNIKVSLAGIIEEYLIITAITELCNICVYSVVVERTALDRTIYRWAKLGVYTILEPDETSHHIVEINNNWLNTYVSRAQQIIIDYINNLTEKIIIGDRSDVKLIKFTYLKLGSTLGRDPLVYTILLTANYSAIRVRSRINTH